LNKELEEILRRLGELLPGPAPTTDWNASIAFRWRVAARPGAPGWLQPVRQVHRIKLADLRGIDKQIARVEQNTKQFLAGQPANNVLLTGARGTGKSSIVKGLLNKYSKLGLRLIEVEKNDLVDLPQIVDGVAGRKERFLVFCDDLSFHGAEDGYIALKVALDGSISTTSENMLIYATSKNMLKDRVTALREANIYEPQRYRHLIGAIKLQGEHEGGLSVVANLLVVRTMQDGAMSLFAAGRYVDRLVRQDGAWRFARKEVVLDSRQIDTLLAMPL